MAIKLVNLDSANHEGYLPVQDFLMVNHPVFTIANVEDYQVLSQVLLDTFDPTTMTENPLKFIGDQMAKGGNAAARATRTRELVGRKFGLRPLPSGRGAGVRGSSVTTWEASTD